jgi:hypothetical protein
VQPQRRRQPSGPINADAPHARGPTRSASA